MSLACPAPATDLGAMRALLANVDCTTRHYAEAGFVALTGPQSFYPQALTALLTIVVALLGYRLLLGLGGARLAEAPLLALKIGAVLALTLQWPLFQTLVFDVAYKAPLRIAATVLADDGARSDPLGGAQEAYDALIADGIAFGRGISPMSPDATSRVRAAENLGAAAQRLFLATAGTLSAALVAVGVLSAVGPIFVALLLFGATRGLFIGWVRALLAAAFAPMLIWGVTALMVEVLRPSLAALAVQSIAASPDFTQVGATVAIVDAFALAQAALVVGGLVMALGFRPARLRRDPAERRTPAYLAAPPVSLSRAERLAEALRQPGSAGGRGDAALMSEQVGARRFADLRFDRAPLAAAGPTRLAAGDRAPQAQRRPAVGRRPAGSRGEAA